MGCHFLLQCRKVTSGSEVAQSCPTLHNPMDRSLPGSSIHGIGCEHLSNKGFPGSSEGKSACNSGGLGSIPGLGRFSGEGNGYPLQYSCLENSMDRGAWCRLLLSMGSQGFPGGSDGKASAYNVGDLDLIPGSGRSSGEGNGNPLQYSCLENPMDGRAW